MWIYLLAALALVFLTLLYLFNRLIRDRNLMREAWSDVDVQLKRRNDLVPALVETVKGYSAHEKKIFEDIAQIRAQASDGSLHEREASETSMSKAIKGLFAVAEAYPDLKANQNFLDLQKNLTEIEDQIQYARRYYNGCVRNYNNRVQSFPGLIVAKLLAFPEAEFFEIELATERANPEVKL